MPRYDSSQVKDLTWWPERPERPGSERQESRRLRRASTDCRARGLERAPEQASVAESVAEIVAQVPTVLLSLPDSAVVDAVSDAIIAAPGLLTKRVVDTSTIGIAQARLHRIRYVWPYSGGKPIVIRDTTLAMPPGRKAPVQRITWLDQERNSFRAGPIFEVTVRASNLFVHELEAEDFRLSGGIAADLDPMSNISYRVYQLRITPSSLWFRIVTGALVGLLGLAAIAAILALRRRHRADLTRQETFVT